MKTAILASPENAILIHSDAAHAMSIGLVPGQTHAALKHMVAMPVPDAAGMIALGITAGWTLLLCLNWRPRAVLISAFIGLCGVTTHIAIQAVTSMRH